uniref:Calcium binding and coiled-coil domain 1 n=1 Tax=Nomascus leucogenys TaxID=61853 RepID=A0A2I3HFH1_NOMLE
MEESPLSRAPSPGGVNFLNVARTYIPNTKVECHYTLPPGTMPSASDWIGIFKVEAACVRDYHTFVWSSVPESTTDGSPIHTSVQFQEPRPMDELVTLEEADGGSDILLVVPKATVLQNQLDESQQERNDLMQLKLQLEGQVTELRSRVQELERALATARQEHTELMEQYKGISRSHGEITEERDILSRQQGDHVARILELEDDIQTISEKVLTKEVELDRLRDTVKALTREQEKLLGQLKEVQADKEQSEAELEPLKEQLRGAQELAASSQQKATLLGEELASAAAARDRTIAELHRSRLEVAEVNGRLAELGLHLKEEKCQWSKERAGLLQSVEAEKDKILKLSAEILRLEKAVQEERTQNQVFKTELAREKDSSLVQLSESKRELTELRSALRVLQKEKEQLQEEKQELLEYMRKLEARLEKVADEKWNEDATTEDEEAAAGLSCPAALTDSEDESPEDMRLPSYGLCERGDPGSSPAGPREASPLVVISQPAPISPHLSGPAEDSSSDSEAEDEKSVLMAAVQSGGEEANLLLPELGSAFYDMARWAQGREGGCCHPSWLEQEDEGRPLPAESDKDALEDHMDGHSFSTRTP